LQGVFGAALIPMSQAVLFDVYPPEQHGRAMAIWGIGVVLGPTLGPMLGGWLTDNYSWRWVFYINVPFGILAVLGVLAYFPRHHARAQELRLLRLRHAQYRCRRVAGAAGSRTESGLVQFR
jgi:DHA2 family multidrug resistance protein